MSSSTKVKSSLLLLTQTFSNIRNNIKPILEETFRYTNNNLYIYINPKINNHLSSSSSNLSNSGNKEQLSDRYQIKILLNQFYQSSFKINPKINVTCLLHNYHPYSCKRDTKHDFNYDLVITDLLVPNEAIDEYLKLNLPNFKKSIEKIPFHTIDYKLSNESSVKFEEAVSDRDQIFGNKVYMNSILGGTFDRLHIGHKIMLSEAALLTQNRLLAGVTSESLLVRKKLTELIEDIDARCQNVKNFLYMVAPNLDVLTVPISDPFGPSITERDYQGLIVSEETIKNGELINEKRKENNLPLLEIHVISLIKDDEKVLMENNGDEDKVSSSNERRRLLGTLLKAPYIAYNPNKPYVIGLTGGLASGKSNIRNDLEKLGVPTIDCDKLGHKTYEKDTRAYKKIIEVFGADILDANQNIDRKSLGKKVFEQPNELKKLTDIVWPEIKSLLQEQVDSLFNSGHKIIVAEAAVLIDAKWHESMNEVWVCFVPYEEAIRRATERDGSNIEKVKGILNSQMSNKERIKYANVVFCSLWEREYTIKQVKKAWSLLLNRTIRTNLNKL